MFACPVNRLYLTKKRHMAKDNIQKRETHFEATTESINPVLYEVDGKANTTETKTNGKHTYRLEDLSLTDLLAIRECNDITLAYYDNLSKANLGMYSDYNKSEYMESMHCLKKYRELKEAIFFEIKSRTDSIVLKND